MAHAADCAHAPPAPLVSADAAGVLRRSERCGARVRARASYRGRMQSPGEYPDVVEIVVEIPRGSRNKYEFDEEAGVFRLDRVL